MALWVKCRKIDKIKEGKLAPSYLSLEHVF